MSYLATLFNDFIVVIYLYCSNVFVIMGDFVLSTITVRIDPEIKKKMRKFSYINWSEVVREAILKKLREEERKNVAEALLINEKLRRKAPEGWDSAEVIRSWRRKR